MRRYPFAKETYDLEQLRDELLAAELPCVGACGSGDVVEVLLSEAVPDGLARCAAVVGAHVPRTESQRLRAAAVQSLLTATDPISVAVRAFVRDLYTAINDGREARGLPRETEPEIVGRVIAGIGGGLGEPG